MPSDADHLRHAARLAWRGHGLVEPNPMVGCVIVDDDGRVVGAGHHRVHGGPHAEIDALRSAGVAARDATAYVTLEPCNHHGKTGPCSEALIEAGVRRVVYARPDTSPASGGGAGRLREAGVEVVVCDGCWEAGAVGMPFAHRIATGRPLVIAKWAQTIDGRVATRCGQSQWISGTASRRRVHQIRARIDAIMTGIGTAIGDDPMLTARDVRRRRTARRVVVDPDLAIPLGSRLVETASYLPTTVACGAEAAGADLGVVERLESKGVEVIQLEVEAGSRELDCGTLLAELAARHDVASVLVEAGPGLLSRLLRMQLIDIAWIFVAPLLMADELAVPCTGGLETPLLEDALRLQPIRMRRRGDDLELVASMLRSD